MVTMLGARDLSVFVEHVGELREANIVTLTRFSSRASEQQSIDIAAPSIDVAALSSVPAAHVPVRLTHVKFMTATQMVGHYTKHARGGIAGHTNRRSHVQEDTDTAVLDVDAHSQQDTVALDSALHDPSAVPDAAAS
ncbi:hypothetical protein Q3G72_031961 [Acer saccharum]|nr:hypothetical protein Q3G72_031961 [Acer saccharum]